MKTDIITQQNNTIQFVEMGTVLVFNARLQAGLHFHMDELFDKLEGSYEILNLFC